MNRLFRILFGLFVAVHIFFLFRYSTPLPCNAASHRIYEVLAADKVIGPFILIGVSVQGEEEFISSFVERIDTARQGLQWLLSNRLIWNSR